MLLIRPTFVFSQQPAPLHTRQAARRDSASSHYHRARRDVHHLLHDARSPEHARLHSLGWSAKRTWKLCCSYLSRQSWIWLGVAQRSSWLMGCPRRTWTATGGAETGEERVCRHCCLKEPSLLSVLDKREAGSSRCSSRKDFPRTSCDQRPYWLYCWDCSDPKASFAIGTSSQCEDCDRTLHWTASLGTRSPQEASRGGGAAEETRAETRQSQCAPRGAWHLRSLCSKLSAA